MREILSKYKIRQHKLAVNLNYYRIYPHYISSYWIIDWKTSKFAQIRKIKSGFQAKVRFFRSIPEYLWSQCVFFNFKGMSLYVLSRCFQIKLFFLPFTFYFLTYDPFTSKDLKWALGKSIFLCFFIYNIYHVENDSSSNGSGLPFHLIITYTETIWQYFSAANLIHAKI